LDKFLHIIVTAMLKDNFEPILALINKIKRNVIMLSWTGLWNSKFWMAFFSHVNTSQTVWSKRWESPCIWIQSHLLRCGAHGHFDVITLSWLSTKVVNHVYKTNPTDSSACPGDSRGAPGGRGLWQGPLLQRDTEQQWVRAASGGAAREKGHQCPWTQKHSRHPHLYTLENPFV